MQDLQEVTQEIHYENFRSERIAAGGGTVARKIKSVVNDINSVELFDEYDHVISSIAMLNLGLLASSHDCWCR